jgi:hypothetical protein
MAVHTGYLQVDKIQIRWYFCCYVDRVDGFLNKRVQSICNRLAKESSTECKGKMLKGEISPKELSNDDEEMYFDQKMKDHIRRMQLEVIQSSRTDFYD